MNSPEEKTSAQHNHQGHNSIFLTKRKSGMLRLLLKKLRRRSIKNPQLQRSMKPPKRQSLPLLGPLSSLSEIQVLLKLMAKKVGEGGVTGHNFSLQSPVARSRREGSRRGKRKTQARPQLRLGNYHGFNNKSMAFHTKPNKIF